MGRILALAACAMLAAGPALGAEATMRISHQVPTAHHLHGIVTGFAEDVQKRTNGAVEVKVFPAEQLSKAGENYPAVARGAIEAALAVNFQWGNTIPEMNAPTIPFYFVDLEKIRKFPQSEARKFLDQKLAEKGVKSIAWLYITRLSIFTSKKKPILTLEDFQGLKIRGLNTLTDNGLKA